VPPFALLAAVHGIALAVRAGASGRVYFWAVTATGLIGLGAFGVSFIALRDLMLAIGYSAATAWAFPAIIDTAVAVSTAMLVALGDKPVRRSRAATPSPETQIPVMQRLTRRATQGARAEVTPAGWTPEGGVIQPARVQNSASAQPDPAQKAQDSAQPPATTIDAEVAQVDADCALDLITSGATTQPIDTVLAVLAATRDGASINAAARASGINYRTAQRIVKSAAERQQPQLVAVG
jgi:hypothetical protein